MKCRKLSGPGAIAAEISFASALEEVTIALQKDIYHET